MKIVPNRIIIILAVFFLSVTNAFADPEPPPPSSPPPPPGLPLDGGIFLLGLFAMCYGIYKLHKKNIKKASN